MEFMQTQYVPSVHIHCSGLEQSSFQNTPKVRRSATICLFIYDNEFQIEEASEPKANNDSCAVLIRAG